MIPFPKQPKDVEFLELPEDITSEPDLTNLMSKFASWAAYADYKATEAEVAVMRLEKEKKKVFAEEMVRATGKSVAAKKAAAEQHPRVVKIEQDIAEHTEQMLLIRSIMRGYDRKSSVVGRELSRRQSRSY